MSKPRIFTFGCSFTNHQAWPTWANIIEKEYSNHYKLENWGREGACNYFVFNSIIECDIKNKINKDDIVIVMWTSMSRESRYVAGEWVTPGSIYNNRGVYPDEYVKRFADDRGYMIRDYSLIYSIDNLLKNIGCKYYFLSMIDLENADEKDILKPKNHDLIKNYYTVLAKVRPSVHNIVFDENWYSRPNIKKDFSGLSERYKEKFLDHCNEIKDQYNNFAGSSWPTFEDYYNDNYTNISQEIKTEISFLEKKLNWNIVKKDFYRFDTHPTPSEHLMYINSVLPEFEISKSTSDWVDLIDKKVLNCEKINKYWVNTTVKRW